MSRGDAAISILGVSERTFRRWRDRYEAEGLYDRRLGRVSARRAAVDTVARVLELFETRYRDFTAKHFHEKLVAEHGFGLSYNSLKGARVKRLIAVGDGALSLLGCFPFDFKGQPFLFRIGQSGLGLP